MRRNILAIVLLSVSSLVLAEAPADPGALATRLVRAMQVDQLTAMGMSKSAEMLQKRGVDASKVECVRGTKAGEFTPAMAKIAAQVLSVDEMNEAIRFYESASGRKYVQMTEVQSAQGLGIPTSKEIPEFTPGEVAEAEKFGTTQVYRKLVTENILTRSPAGRSVMQARVAAIFKGCGVAP